MNQRAFIGRGDLNPRNTQTKNRCNTIDTHELLKQEIFKNTIDDSAEINRFMNARNAQTTAAPSNTLMPVNIPVPEPERRGAFEEYSFHFDSSLANTNERDSGILEWNLNSTSNTNKVTNCVRVIISPMFFPRIQNDANKPDFFFNRRMFLDITDFPFAQTVQADNNNRYHFEFEVDNLNSTSVTLKPISNSYTLSRPFNTITRLRVRFSTSPRFRAINLPADVMQVVSVANSNPARFTITSGTVTTAAIGPVGLLAVPAAAYFEGFESGNITLNANVNTFQGHFITTIVDGTTFEIADLSLAGTAAHAATMYIYMNNISFRATFVCLADTPSTYIQAVS